MFLSSLSGKTEVGSLFDGLVVTIFTKPFNKKCLVPIQKYRMI